MFRNELSIHLINFITDSNGNAMLHTLVINDKLEMFLYASNHPKKKAFTNTKNAQGLTPFNLAAKLARKDIFTRMLEINAIVKLLIFINPIFINP